MTEQRGPAFAECFFGVREALAGVHGLSNPKPGSATLAQVTYVYPRNYTESRNKGLCIDVPRQGRALMLALRQDGQTSKGIWGGFVKEFCDFLGSLLAILEDFTPVDDNASALSVRMEHEAFTTHHLVLFVLQQIQKRMCCT